MFFAHRLGLALGVWNIDWLMDVMPASMLQRWMDFDGVEPINPSFDLNRRFDRLEYMVANITSMLYERWKSENAKSLKLEDFIPEETSEKRKDKKEKSPEDVKALIDFWVLDQKIKQGIYKPPDPEDSKENIK
jgi:hypothetical protein